MATATVTAGDTVTGGTSGATGVALNTIASGATGTMNINVTSLSPGKAFIAGETVTSSSTGTFVIAAFSATNPLTSSTLGLRLTDTGGYYNAKGTKLGATEVRVADNFAATDLTVTTPAVYGIGQGNVMIDMYPVLERTSSNLASGSHYMAINNRAVSGTGTSGAGTYRTYIIKVKKNLNVHSSMVNAGGSIAEMTYLLYVQVTGSYADVQTDIAALT